MLHGTSNSKAIDAVTIKIEYVKWRHGIGLNVKWADLRAMPIFAGWSLVRPGGCLRLCTKKN